MDHEPWTVARDDREDKELVLVDQPQIGQGQGKGDAIWSPPGVRELGRPLLVRVVALNHHGETHSRGDDAGGHRSGWSQGKAEDRGQDEDEEHRTYAAGGQGSEKRPVHAADRAVCWLIAVMGSTVFHSGAPC